jgi:two-component sensor histidine kinase
MARMMRVRTLVTAAWIGLAVLPLRAQSPEDQLLPDQTELPLPDRTDSLQSLLRRGVADTNRVQVLLELGTYYLSRARQTEIAPDSAGRYARQAHAASTALQYGEGQVRSTLLLGRVYLEKGSRPAADSCFNAALALVRQTGDLRRQAQTWLQVGNYYPRTDENLPRKMQYYTQALSLYRRAGRKEGEAVALRAVADLHQFQGKLTQALHELLQVVQLQQSANDPYIYQSYALLGYVYRIMGNNQEALRYHLASLKSAQAAGDTTDLSPIYYRIGKVYRDAKQLPRALDYYRKSLVIRERIEAPTLEILKAAREIHNVLLALEKPEAAQAFLQNMLRRYPARTGAEKLQAALCLGDSYLAMHTYKAAEKHYLEALHLSEQNFVIRLAVLFRLGKFYQARGQYEKARHYLEKALAMNAQRPILAMSRDIHLQLFKLDSVQARFFPAIAHYQQYKALSDSLFSESRSNQLLSVQAGYENEKKDNYIALLTQQSRAQQATIGQRQAERNALVGGALALLLLLGVLYNRYRLKWRSNRQLQAQQEELQAQHEEMQAQQEQINRQNEHLSELLLEKDSLLGQKDMLLEEKEGLLKEIHHRVKNNLQVVMSLLNSQAASLADKAALSAIRESQHRVQAMALIHQKLYQSEGLARIPMQAYIKELVAYLRDSYRLSQPVRFRLEVESIEIDVTQAVPLGLILNEAVTNACKYAFPGGRAGTVNISLCRVPGVEPGAYQLRIEDDGVGLPEGFHPARSRSLGMTLMHGFSRQLGGKLTIDSPPGLAISLTFTDEKPTFSPTPPVYAYQSV